MGREAKPAVSDGGTRAEARVHLDSELLSVGPPFRLKLKLAEVTACAAEGEALVLAAGRTRLTLALGAKDAASWAKAILNPPSLAAKLGLKAGAAAATLGPMPQEIGQVLEGRGARALTSAAAAKGAGLVFAAVPEGIQPETLNALAKALEPGAAAWLVYRKGGTINGEALIRAARAAGLKDTKVARISESHAGLRFIAAKA